MLAFKINKYCLICTYLLVHLQTKQKHNNGLTLSVNTLELYQVLLYSLVWYSVPRRYTPPSLLET